ncbi:cyclase family protein [Rhodobaculum claviforme]|uniref:Cyclase n=1 Tax=Rhodobaculum claviforme TaxID=1549854 RepID=A0A934TL56_9RHOB|nr:cyclase family protein [Rhodobaculum claviforme]MBK5928144.1 cyclase [Rhodobaculum claviforme]
MCHVCVTEAVKARMLSRRDLFRASAAGAVVAGGTMLGAAPAALAQGAARVVDLTHTHSPDFPTFGGAPGLSFDQQFAFDADGYNLNVLTLDEHTGTHIDAPLHFSADGLSVDELPLSQLVVPLCVIDIRARAAADRDAQVTPDDLAAWIAAHGPIPDNACVAMNSGWAARVGDASFRGDAEGLHFPGFHIEATRMLLEETRAAVIAVDTLSLDHGPSPDFATHYAWLPAGRYGIECIAGLDDVPAAGATLVVGAPKFRGGTGGPARVLALV